MLLGRSVIFLLILVLVAICVFVIAQWAIPVLFALVDVVIPSRVVNILALLIALGVVYGGWNRPP